MVTLTTFVFSADFTEKALSSFTSIDFSINLTTNAKKTEDTSVSKTARRKGHTPNCKRRHKQQWVSIRRKMTYSPNVIVIPVVVQRAPDNGFDSNVVGQGVANCFVKMLKDEIRLVLIEALAFDELLEAVL